jgi:hypothetical protein
MTKLPTVTLIWICGTCGKEKKVSSPVEDGQIKENDVWPPKGFTTCNYVKPYHIDCDACRAKHEKQYLKENPNFIALA